MQVLFALAALAALAAALPQASENRPSGRLVLLPARQEQAASAPDSEDAANGTRGTDESQPQVLNKGEYYVLLEDGRLQMVKYTTAALPAENDGTEDVKAPDATQEPSSARYAQQRYPVYYAQAENAQNARSAKYSAPAQAEQPRYYAQFPHAQFAQPKEAAQSAKYSAPTQPEQYPFYYVQAESAQPKEAANAQSAKYSKPAQPEPYPFYYVQAETPEAEAPARYSAPAQADQYPKYYAQFAQSAKYTAPAQPQAERAQKTAKYSAPAVPAAPAAPAGDLQDQEQPAGFEANLQYRDVKPISAPIYAYNSAPLVRILKK